MQGTSTTHDLIQQQQGNLDAVASQTGLAKSTLYGWLAEWNQDKRTEKKNLTSRRGQDGGLAPRVGAERWEAWREHLQGQQTRH